MDRTSRKRASLTNGQKKHRRDNNLCMYCGDPGHSITGCFRHLTKRKTVPDMAIPENPVSPESLHGPPAVTGTTIKKTDETRKEVGLLTLPRELRNKIYEELLCLEEFQVQQFGEWRKLDPRILAVSRQIHHEASEVFYDKNGWITLTVVDWVLRSLAGDSIQSRAGFPGHGHNQPIARYKNDQLSKSAILDISLTQSSDAAQEMVDLVIPLAALPRFCRLLTQSHWVINLDLVLHFSHRPRERHLSRLLGHLGQARGLQSVAVTGAEPPWAVVNTALLMTHPYRRIVEIVNSVSAYQESSKQESKHGRTLDARNVVQDGTDFVDWWLDEIEPQIALSLFIRDEEMDELVQTRADMGFSCASLSTLLGNIDAAQRAIERTLDRLRRTQRLCETHKACAHHHMAQTFEAVGWKNAALYSYLQALRIRPGYQDADAAVDRMEQNLGPGTTLEDARTRHNILRVLKSFRHRHTSSTVVSSGEYDTIFEQFDGTAAEIRSLGRRTQGEADLVYMNPNHRGGGRND